MFIQDYDPLPVAERVFADLNNVAAENHQRFAVVYREPTALDALHCAQI
jgi:hypothetical protein